MINDLINNQVTELFALMCFLVGSAIGYAVAKDSEGGESSG